jgi:hypothetical protein
MRMKKSTKQFKKDLLLIIKQNGICFSIGEEGPTIPCKRCPITSKESRKDNYCGIKSDSAYSSALQIFVAHYGKEELLNALI